MAVKHETSFFLHQFSPELIKNTCQPAKLWKAGTQSGDCHRGSARRLLPPVDSVPQRWLGAPVHPWTGSEALPRWKVHRARYLTLLQIHASNCCCIKCCRKIKSNQIKFMHQMLPSIARMLPPLGHSTMRIREARVAQVRRKH